VGANLKSGQKMSKTYFSVILKGVKDLISLKLQDASLRSALPFR